MEGYGIVPSATLGAHGARMRRTSRERQAATACGGWRAGPNEGGNEAQRLRMEAPSASVASSLGASTTKARLARGGHPEEHLWHAPWFLGSSRFPKEI